MLVALIFGLVKRFDKLVDLTLDHRLVLDCLVEQGHLSVLIAEATAAFLVRCYRLFNYP